MTDLHRENAVSRFLTRRNVPVVNVQGADEQTDGEVEIAGGYSIQVGTDYYIANRYEGEGDTFCCTSGPARGKLSPLLLADLIRLGYRTGGAA